MGDDSSHSIFDSILTNLKKIQENLSKESSELSNFENAETDLEVLDIKQSMGLHRKLLDHEVDSINSELVNLLKNKDSIDYLISLVEKRERIANQINRIDRKIGTIEREQEKGVS